MKDKVEKGSEVTIEMLKTWKGLMGRIGILIPGKDMEYE